MSRTSEAGRDNLERRSYDRRFSLPDDDECGHAASFGRRSDQSNYSSLISTIQLIGITFFAVSGGPYGFEDVIGAGGGMLTITGLLLVPLLWSGPIALMTAEMACMMPEPGGHILWVYHAFGPFWSFLNSVFTFACSIFDTALYPALFINYLSFWLYGNGEALSLAKRLFFKIGMLIVVASMNVAGADVVGTSSVLLGTFMIAPFLVMFIMGLPRMNLLWVQAPLPKPVNWSQFLPVLLWNTSGFDSAGACVTEVHDPARSYPRALGFSLVLMILIYAGPTILGLSILPYFQLWENGTFLGIAMEVGGNTLKVWMCLAAVMSAFGLLLTRICMSSRLLHGMLSVHQAPASLRVLHGSFGTPWVAIVIIVSCTMLLSGLDFTFLSEVDMVLYSISTILKFGALIQLRASEPEAYRPFEIPLETSWLVCLSAFPVMLCIITVAIASKKAHFIAMICLLAAISGFVALHVQTILPSIARTMFSRCQLTLSVVCISAQRICHDLPAHCSAFGTKCSSCISRLKHHTNRFSGYVKLGDVKSSEESVKKLSPDEALACEPCGNHNGDSSTFGKGRPDKFPLSSLLQEARPRENCIHGRVSDQESIGEAEVTSLVDHEDVVEGRFDKVLV